MKNPVLVVLAIGMLLLGACRHQETTTVQTGPVTQAPEPSVHQQAETVPDPLARPDASAVAEFKAVGQEPGWHLTIQPGRQIAFVGDYGETTATTPAPEPVRDPQAGTLTYHARTQTDDLKVVIRNQPCQDIMSGRPYDHTVEVTLNGRTYQGCGEYSDLGSGGN